MKIDLHVHSKYSLDNYSEPEEIIEVALQKKLDGLLITEHHSYEASEPWEEWRSNPKKNKGLLILRAVEISTSYGHVIVLGFKDDSWKEHFGNPEPCYDLDTLLAKVDEINAVSILAHPFRENMNYPIRTDLNDIDRYTAVEGINAGNTAGENRRAIRMLEALGMPYTGGSDAHAARNVGNAYTYFDKRIETLDDLMLQLRAGRFTAHAGNTKIL